MKKDTHNNFIEYGSLFIKELKVIGLVGDLSKVDELLQGQLTSDHTQMTEDSYQLSSICNHKGQVIADFIISKKNNAYRLVIDKSLKNLLIQELSPFAKLHRVEIEDVSNIVIGNVSPRGILHNPYSLNKTLEVSISIEDSDFKNDDSISIENWNAANKILGNFFMQLEDAEKYRPIEINYDNLRVSFDKGCYRGQEIVARMKYLGVDRRKFCTFIVNNKYEIDQNIKIVGKIINLNDLKIFNAIIKRDGLKELKKNSDIVKII